jgi:hypothetical protein
MMREQRLDAAGRGADGQDMVRRGAIVRSAGARASTGPRARARPAAIFTFRVSSEKASMAVTPAPGLATAVDGAQFQGLQRDLGAGLGQGRDHDHRHRPQPHDLLEELQPVHIGHLDVESDDVGVQALIAARASSGSAAEPTTSISGSRRRAAVIRPRMVGGVVDDENATIIGHAASL